MLSTRRRIESAAAAAIQKKAVYTSERKVTDLQRRRCVRTRVIHGI